MVESLSFHVVSSQSRNCKMFTYLDFNVALQFINTVRTQEMRNFIFKCEKVKQLGFSLEYNSKIAVRKLIFHYMINPSVILKQKLT